MKKSIGKTLWRGLGPLLIAALLVAALMLIPFRFGKTSQATIKQAASSLSSNVLKGENLKNEAMAENYVPFIGSSELSRMDPLHPSVLAAKYHREYTPFLMGAAGTQSLTHFLSVNALTDMTGKKAVMIISPQWFTKMGARKDQFDFYYSPMQTTTFLLHANPKSTADQYAAKRLLTFPSTASDRVIVGALKNIASGLKLDDGQWWYLKNFKAPMSAQQNRLFSELFMPSKEQTIQQGVAQLPQKDDFTTLDLFASKLGQRETTSNDFGIKNDFFKQRVKKALPKLRDSQRRFDYLSSPEYSDFQLLLQTYAKKHMDVMFVIPPINAKWANYTGLDQNMIQATVQKMKYQLRSQGFDRIVDMSQDGSVPYFMQDTIHLGWRGWLQMDQKVAPFLKETRTKTPPTYHLNDSFYNRAWQQDTKF